jgi:hypothetical protein
MSVSAIHIHFNVRSYLPSVIDTLLFSGIDKIIGFALSHQLKNCTNPDPPLSNVQFVLSSERFQIYSSASIFL